MDAESRFMLANETYPKEDNLQAYDATLMFRRAVHIAKTVPSDRLSGFARGFKNAMLGVENTIKKIKNPYTYEMHQYKNAISTTVSLSVKTARQGIA